MVSLFLFLKIFKSQSLKKQCRLDNEAYISSSRHTVNKDNYWHFLSKILFHFFRERKIENNHINYTIYFLYLQFYIPHLLFLLQTRFAWSFPVTLSFETIQQKRYLMFLVVYREVIGALLLQLVFTQLLLLLSPRLTYTL